MTERKERFLHLAKELSGYKITYKHIETQPDVKEFYSLSKRQIVINLAAQNDAKIYKVCD